MNPVEAFGGFVVFLVLVVVTGVLLFVAVLLIEHRASRISKESRRQTELLEGISSKLSTLVSQGTSDYATQTAINHQLAKLVIASDRSSINGGDPNPQAEVKAASVQMEESGLTKTELRALHRYK